MALQDQTIPIHFGQGVETLTDEKLVVAGKMLRLENAVFDKNQSINKRSGYLTVPNAVLASGSVVSPALVFQYQDELVCADKTTDQIYAFSDTQDAWAPKGYYHPIQVSAQNIAKASATSYTYVSAAQLGDIVLYVWDNRGIPTASVIDTLTNTILIAEQELSTAQGLVGSVVISSCPKACVLASAKLAVFYQRATGELVMRILTVSGITVSLGSEIVMAATPARYQSISTVINSSIFIQYDVVNTLTGATLVVSTAAAANGAPTGMTIQNINTTGAITATQVVSGVTAFASPVHLCRDKFTQDIWLYYVRAGSLRYRIYTSALGTALGETTIAAMPGAGQAITAKSTASGAQTVWFCEGIAGAPGAFIRTAALLSTGVVGPVTTLIRNVVMQSEVFTVAGVDYLNVVNVSNTQSGYFTIRTSDAAVIAKAFVGKGADYRFPSFLADTIGSATRIVVPGSVVEELTVHGAIYPVYGAQAMVLDFDSKEAYQALIAQDSALLNGGLVSSYDGKFVVESGFHLFPDHLVAQPNQLISGTGLPNGTYRYQVIWRWSDNNGNLYESAPSEVVATLINPIDNQGYIDISFDSLTLTQKRGTVNSVEARIYRSKVGGSEPFYELNVYQADNLLNPILNNPNVSRITYTDLALDPQIQNNGILYTFGGIVENIGPPASVAMTVHNNRVFLIQSDDPTLLWYSKSMSPGTGINFSDLFTVRVNALGGDCVALASMDDKLVILKNDIPLVMGGDGANDTGFGSTLTLPQPIPTDTGCLTSKGVAVFPMGILFKSPKGIYLLDRSLNVKYWGADVDAYNDQRIVQSTMNYDRKQIRFLTDAGLCLVFDYLYNQWSTFTNHMGLSATIWRGQYVYARTDGAIFKEEPDHYLDNTVPFSVLVQTAWLALASVQGFQRVKKFESLGTFQNGVNSTHGVRVSAAYDFVSTFSPPIPYVFGLAAASGVFQYRERLPRQKCDTISLLIEEVVSNDPLESIVLTDMSFEAGVKKGLNKVPQTGMVS